MPDVTFSPTQGRVSRVSGDEQLASQMQDFVLRKAISDRQAQLAQQGLTQQGDLAREQMGLQERLQGNEIGAQRDIQGTFGDRSAAQSALMDKQLGGQRDIAGIGAKSALDVAREGNAPQLGALSLAQRQYDDQRGDTAGKRSLENMKANIALQALGGQPIPSGGETPRTMTSAPAQSPSSLERMRQEMDAGLDTGSAADRLSAPAVQRRPAIGPGASGNYKVDQNTMDTMKSMRDQLAGQGKDVSRLDMLANADQELLARKGAAEPQIPVGKPDQAAVQRVIDGTVRAEAPKGASFLDTLSPDQRNSVLGGLLGINIPQDPVKAAESAQKIADIQGGPLGAIQKKSALMGATQQIGQQAMASPLVQQLASELKQIAPTGDADQFRAKMSEMQSTLTAYGMPPEEATAVIRKIAQEAAPSAVMDRLSQGMSLIPGVGLARQFLSKGGAFPDRSGVRQAAGLE